MDPDGGASGRRKESFLRRLAQGGPAARRYSEEELRAFEAVMGVALPEDYRRYLRDVGSGGAARNNLSLLEDWAQPLRPEEMPPAFLAEPFPHSAAWNDRALGDAAYLDARLWRGSMRIVHMGGETYYLLVVSGPERGMMWIDERASVRKGIYPLTAWSGRRLSFATYVGLPPLEPRT